MYLTALITKWRNKNIKFMVETPKLDKFELTACLLDKRIYVSVIADSLEECCKIVDVGISRHLVVEGVQ
jgi:hypothetical protein